jgi:hypothetical protein
MLGTAPLGISPGLDMKALAFVILLSAVPVYGHHSLSEYDAARELSLTVVVREFHFVNPHPYLIAEARAGSLSSVWRLELDNRFELVQIGMTASTFTPGEQLLVSGRPGRDQKPILYVRELDRPADGFRYEQLSSSPRIVRPPRNSPRPRSFRLQAEEE